MLNRKVKPSCGKKSYKNWPELEGSNKLVFPTNVVITFFDNIGKYVIKNYLVFASNRSTADVVTALLHFQINSRSQKRCFSKTWVDFGDIIYHQKKVKELIETVNSLFR